MTSLTLLSNASATSTEATWPGGPGVFMVAGSMPRGRVDLQFQLPDGASWVDVGPDTCMDTPGAGRFSLPAGVKIRASLERRPVAGAQPAGIYAVVGTLNADPLAAVAAIDRELATVTYLVKTAFTGAAVGDTVTLTQVLDLSGAQPATMATLWRNQSTATDLAGAPSAANLTIAGAGGLTSAQLPGTLGAKASSASLSTTPATDANVARETYSSAPIQKVTTPVAGGTAFQLLAAVACSSLDLANPTTVDIEYQRGAAGAAFPIPAGGSRTIVGITNANQIGVRRRDGSTAQVDLYAEAFVA
jgi:hypothetical protein